MRCSIPLVLVALLSASLPTAERTAFGTEAAADPAPDAATPRELIGDPHFERGCVLWEPKPGKHVKYGELLGVAKSSPPAWGLAQWSSGEKLAPGSPRTLPSGGLLYANAAKSVVFGPPDSEDADIALAVFGGVEYGERARKAGEPWVHLLLEQQFEDPPTLSELTEARFHVEARTKMFRKFDTPDYSPNLHAAQNQIFFTLANTNPDSPGYGKLLWFGVPLFDDRARIPPGHQAQDTAVGDGQGMFIYTVPAAEFTTRSLHDDDWVVFDKDLLPHMLAGMETAWKAGFLNESRSLADYRVTGMNMGWEVPGVFDVESQYRNLSLKVTTQPKAD